MICANAGLFVLPAGNAFPPHRLPGEVTLQCLAGRLALDVDGVRQVLGAGQLCFLEGGVQHGLVGLEDSSALVTLVLRGG